MKKSNILFFLAAIIIVAAVASLAYLKKYHHPAISLPKEKETIRGLPASDDKMVVSTTKGDVIINNVYKNSIQIANSNVLLKDTLDYQIVYISNPQSFVISILGQDILSAREKAEQDFLQTLGINKDQACLLNVSLGVDKSINEKIAGKNYGLSFCPNGKPLPEE